MRNWLHRSFPMISAGLLMVLGFVADVDAGSRVSQDNNNYFKYDGGSFTHYLELRPDGSYRRVVRGHLYMEERDNGKWQQNHAGKLLLRSDQHFQNISSGALLVSMWHRDRLKTLPDLRKKIQVFLKAHRAKEFPSLDVERIRETDTGIGLDAKIGDITVLGAKHVSRSDLETLSSAIETFLSTGEKNLFTLVPLEYKEATIFVEDNRASVAKTIIADELAGGKDSVHAADKHGYQKIDAAQFNEEMKKAPPMLSQSEIN